MNNKQTFHNITGAPASTFGVERAALSDRPVMASALFTAIPAAFGSGNIGRLAVNTVANRLLASGTAPRYVSATVTIDIDTDPNLIEATAMAMSDAAVQAEMEWGPIDTRIIETGPEGGIAISAFAFGSRIASVTSTLRCTHSGDKVIVTGPVGGTGAAIAGTAKGVEVLAPCDGIAMTDVMRAAFASDPSLHAAVYPTEGIVGALALLGAEATFDRKAVPVNPAVAAACRTMGLDPLAIATANAMLLVASPDKATALLEALHRYQGSAEASVIGTIV